MKSHRAFTLLELSVVLLLMAALAAVVVVSLRGTLGAARGHSAAAQVARFDAQARLTARAFPRTVSLRVDHDTLVRRTITDGVAQDLRLPLPQGFTVDAIRPATVESISFSPSGTSPDYALHLAGPGGSIWLAFSGITGASVTITHDADLAAIFPAP